MFLCVCFSFTFTTNMQSHNPRMVSRKRHSTPRTAPIGANLSTTLQKKGSTNGRTCLMFDPHSYKGPVTTHPNQHRQTQKQKQEHMASLQTFLPCPFPIFQEKASTRVYMPRAKRSRTNPFDKPVAVRNICLDMSDLSVS